MGLNLCSIDDLALLVPDGADDGHGLRSQLTHHHLIAGSGATQALETLFDLMQLAQEQAQQHADTV
jgi:hypothetical protein